MFDTASELTESYSFHYDICIGYSTYFQNNIDCFNVITDLDMVT